MSLAQRYTEGPPRNRRPCRVRTILELLPDPDAEALRAMLADAKWSDSKTYDALKSEGVEMPSTDQFLGYHRNRKCDCA